LERKFTLQPYLLMLPPTDRLNSAMFAYIPLVYCFLPETSGRTLEQIDYLFASKSVFTWNEEKEFARRVAILDEQIARKNLEVSEGKGQDTPMTSTSEHV
jgi:hypothetical protein